MRLPAVFYCGVDYVFCISICFYNKAGAKEPLGFIESLSATDQESECAFGCSADAEDSHSFAGFASKFKSGADMYVTVLTDNSSGILPGK